MRALRSIRTNAGRRAARPLLVRGLTVAALVWSLIVPASLLHASAGAAPVSEIGLMRFGFDADSPPKMAVDPVLHRGFFQTHFDGDKLWVYDLERMRLLRTIPLDVQLDDDFAIDTVNHRIFFVRTSASLQCGTGGVQVLDTRRLTITERKIPCYANDSTTFIIRGLSYHAPTNKLYVVGQSGPEVVVGQSTGTYNYHEGTIYRQLDADTLALDWEVDASELCETNTNRLTGPIVGRHGNGVIGYCYVGRQGRAVYIPLRGGRPILDAFGEPTVRLAPTIGSTTTPIIDPGSGRLLMLEDVPPFGPAVWVYDPASERFRGVIASGVERNEGTTYFDYFRGFDERTGRLYILNRRGMVIADTRHSPLPGGVIYPILAEGRNQIFTGHIAIDGGLRRLFLPYPKRGGFVVLEDNVPEPVSLPAADPDRGTADVPEVPGKTGRTFSGAAGAFGLHVLNTGGTPRIVNNSDPLCTSQDSTLNDRDQFGRCPADRVLTSGNREYFVAQSEFEASVDSGTSALAGALRSPSTDTATDADLRAMGRCQQDRVDEVAGQAGASPPPVACPNGEDEPLQGAASGSQGTDGKGYPVRGAACADFDGRRVGDTSDAPAGAAEVLCDAANHMARASAELTAFTLSPQGGLTITVGSASSVVETALTSEGVVTTATAIVRDVRIGSIEIGEIRSEAVSKARGRSKTSFARYSRTFKGVQGPGISCQVCEPSEVVQALNRVLNTNMRARLPDVLELASPRGYQGIVSKLPALRESDRAVNDNDTGTANALDIIVFNDTSPAGGGATAGRSRIVLGFAGVQAESRYGIFLLPESDPFGEPLLPEPFLPPGPEPFVPPVPVPRTDDGIGRVVSAPVAVVVDAFKLVVTNPREAALLFVLWGLFAAPAYLAVRRRSAMKALG